jgi:hypothetical protein
VASFHPWFAFAFGLGPFFTVCKHVAHLLAVEAFLFLNELLAFLICQPLYPCSIQFHWIIGVRVYIIGWLLAFASISSHISQISAALMLLGFC